MISKSCLLDDSKDGRLPLAMEAATEIEGLVKFAASIYDDQDDPVDMASKAILFRINDLASVIMGALYDSAENLHHYRDKFGGMVSRRDAESANELREDCTSDRVDGVVVYVGRER